jgi:hypothetical protein
MLDILFLYRDYAYNYSKISLVGELLKRSIKMECHKVDNIEQAKANYRKCDLLIIHPTLFFEELVDEKICVALASDIDGGWCSPHIHLLPKVNGLIESYAYLPRTLHNIKKYCYCTELLAQAGFKRKTEVGNDYEIPEFSEKDLSKIHVYCGFGSWERMRDIGNNDSINLELPRENPIFFAGTVEYAGTEIEDHRMAAVDMCNQLGGRGVAGRLVQWPEYRKTFLNTKAILSPWGWGEACHRDFEALAFGCLLIKPTWTFVETFPDISSKDAPYIPCRLDFSDVPEIMREVNAHWDWDYIKNIRIRGRELAKEALNPSSNVKRFVEIIECVLNQN